MRRVSIWFLLAFLEIQSHNQARAMSNDISPVILKATPESAIDLLAGQIAELLPMQQKLAACSSFEEKLNIVEKLPAVKAFFDQNNGLKEVLKPLSIEQRYLIKAVVALNQGPVIFANWQTLDDLPSSITALSDKLYALERFYDYMGGIAGYHVKTLQLMRDQLAKKAEPEAAMLHLPPVQDIRQETKARNANVQDGINSIANMAEIYVVGGAGDRLALVDEKTQMPLPVARLQFAGRSLLENLVRDLEAREYLAYKLTAKQSVTPIVLMTSHEKNNDAQIAALLDESGYFGRPKESVFRLLQPMTPVIAIDARWAVSAPCELILKPGGHGVIWKLADEFGAFDWLLKQNRNYMIVRQINNPLAGLDTNLLTLAGYGHANKKAFGFESVPRLPGMSEGMNVLKETKDGPNVLCTISNIEYTEFAKAKLSDPEFAKIADSPDFPANTNILFADIKKVREATKKLPVPGYLVNMKQPVETMRDGQKVSLLGARLESTMQNIADVITRSYTPPVDAKNLSNLETFVLVNDRAKTISVTKKAYDGKSIQETPEGCFYDLVQENLRLLRDVCLFEVAELNTPIEYIQHGPSALFLYNPALGPLYSIIGQKITKGRLAAGSEFEVEASEVSITNLDVDGSLRIIADQVTGGKNSQGLREFSGQVGRCVFENVRVKNKGIDRSAKNVYYKSRIARHESATIHLLGNSECIAKDVEFVGNVEIVVQPGTRALLSQGSDGKLVVQVQDLAIRHPDRLKWQYSTDGNNAIKLNR